MRFIRPMLLVVIAFFILPCLLLAQSDRGQIAGLVTDSTGAIIPHASVTLLNQDTNVTQTTQSDSAGAYLFSYLNPGRYSVTVTVSGFKQFVSTEVPVDVGSHVGVPVRLQLGGTTEQVVVNEHGVALQTEDAVLGNVVDARAAADLPILYGNPFELQLLQPGVLSTSLSNGATTYSGGAEATKINGAQSAQTEFTIDGAPDTRNAGVVTTGYIPARDFVTEFKLVTSPYDASLSHTSGASLDTSLKSGTKDFHGSAAWFYQNSDVNARTYSFGPAGTAPQTLHNRESVDVEGPIVRRRLFFFAGYERQYTSQGVTSLQTVPTDAEKKGDFSALLGLNGTTQEAACTGVVNTHDVYAIANPFTTTPDPRCPGHFVRKLYPNNIITTPLNSVATKILSYYPEPTGSSVQTNDFQNNYAWSGQSVNKYYSVATRIDFTPTENDRFFGHFIYSNYANPAKNEYFPGASGTDGASSNRAGVIDYVHIFNAKTLMNVRTSFTRFQSSITLSARQIDAAGLGINPNVLAGTQLATYAHGFPGVNISGYGALEPADPLFEADNTFVGLASVTRSQGKHQLRSGFEWRLYQFNQADFGDENGNYTSTGTYTKGPEDNSTASPIGQALASFEVGIAENSYVTLNAATSNNTQYFGGFAQDDWKLLPKLTLNLGLRYEYATPVSERHNKSISAFAFNTPNPIAAQAQANYASSPSALLPAAQFQVNGGVLYAGTGSYPSSGLWQPQKMNFSPRIGFAYNATPKLVVRGGFGIFFSHLAEYVQYANADGYTQTTNIVVSNDNGQTYIANLSNPFPNGLVQPSGNSAGMLHGIGQSVNFFSQTPRTPYNERWSLGFEYALPAEFVFEANYVGNNGLHVPISRNYDPLPNAYLSPDQTRTAAQVANYAALTKQVANPFYGISVPAPTSLTGNTKIAQSQLLKPYPEFSNVTVSFDTTGTSTFHSLQLSLRKNFSRGFSTTAAYTQSKSLDATAFLNPGDAKPWYGLSTGDIPRAFAMSSIYELPIGPGKLIGGSLHGISGAVVGGWQVQGTYRVQSGQPVTFSTANMVFSATGNTSNIGSVTQRTHAQWFNTAAFDTVSSHQTEDALRTIPLRFGNVRQDFLNVLNVGAMRKFKIADRVSADLRAEAINALNHPIFGGPNVSPTSSSFGMVTKVSNTSRVLQFAVEGHF